MERIKRVEVRLSTEEHQKMIGLKTKRRLAEWIRETCLNDEVKEVKVVKKIDPDLLFELNRIGVNLNQIAKVVNQKKQDVNVVMVLELLVGIEKQLKEVFRGFL